MGTLRVKGIIELEQFWPKGEADADTTKIQLVVKGGSFEYKEDGAAKFKKTNAFKDAKSVGQVSKEVIKTRAKDGVQTITVRLQGVDAPELHYKAAPLKQSDSITKTKRAGFNKINKEEKRQHFAESASVALAAHLKSFANGKATISAVFESKVEKPFEAIDTYGRFIGNVLVGNGKDINLWLVENGWCSPAFYTSTKPEEINTFLTAWAKGKKIKGRTSQSISTNASKFDWKLIYRKPSTVKKFTIGEDKGPSIMPKIFRRQVAWAVAKKAGIANTSKNFKGHLQKTPDQLMLLKDFLQDGLTAGKMHALHEFVDAKGKILEAPEQLVFQEKPGTLLNKNGKKITAW